MPAPSPATNGGGAANLAVGRPCREWAAARRRDEQGAPGWACGEGAELRRSAGGAKKGRRPGRLWAEAIGLVFLCGRWAGGFDAGQGRGVGGAGGLDAGVIHKIEITLANGGGV